MMNQNSELTSHIRDLADRCFNREITVFSDFLSMAEQSEILSIEREISYVDLTWFGGMEGCERRMLMFSPQNKISCQFPEEIQKIFPIKCLIAEPLMQKFADSLTHRDFLGALMNLGINREVLGDIVVKDNIAYIFCEEKMSDFICENLTKVKHTNIKCITAAECPESAKPMLKEETHIVQSGRCDAVIAKVYNLSRSQSIELFRSKCIFVDGRQCENNSAVLKDGATVSVRGYGKFIFEGVSGQTRKDKMYIKISKYI